MRSDVMQAAVYRGHGELELVERSVPTPAPNEALVEVAFCGVCGTDLHNVLDGWGVRDTVGGHEWSGRVVAVGAEATVRPETLVIGGPDPGCGSCPACLGGRRNLCTERHAVGVEKVDGAFAGFIVVDASTLVPIPDALDLRLAAYAEPLAVALHAVTVAALESGERALVFGAGPIGAGVAAVLLARGHEVTAVEPGETRRRLAASLGASVIEPEALKSSSHPGDVPTDPLDVVFEASGVKAAFESGLGQLRRGGRLVLVGNGMDYPTLDTNRMILNELTVRGAFTYDANGFEDALALIGSGDLPLDVLIEPGSRPLEQVLDVMHELRAGTLAGKVMMQP